MTTDIRGILAHRSGWSGTVTVDDGGGPVAVSPTGHESAHKWLQDLETAAQAGIHASFTLSITTNGYYKMTCNSAFTLVFSSVAVANRFGFSSASYVSATTQTAEAVAPGGWYPYTTEAFYQGLTSPAAARSSVRHYSSAHTTHTPALTPHTGEVKTWTLRTSAHGLTTALSYAATPAKIDIITANISRSVYHLGTISATDSGVLGWTEHRISVTEVL